MHDEAERRGLIVLADGAHAAFAAGALGTLAGAGLHWRLAFGAGLGAQLAALAVLGEAVEGERRWRRQAELGCPLLRPRVRGWRERLGADAGALVLPDVLNLGGWLDPTELSEFLAPEMAGIPERLRRAAVACAVAVHDIRRGACRWEALQGIGPRDAGGILVAAASFPGGWPPWQADSPEGPRMLWGGVSAAPVAAPVPTRTEVVRWDLVCGYPVPATGRPAAGRSLFELVQQRDEARAAEVVQCWERELGSAVRLVAPGDDDWTGLAGRAGADLGLEYPMPWEHNGELVGLVLELGRRVARRVLDAAAP